MSTSQAVELANWVIRQTNAMLANPVVNAEDIYVNEEDVLGTVYLGSTFSLDPCGRHHDAVLSPNGVTDLCVQFWEELEASLERRNHWLHGSDGDGCDVYASRRLRSASQRERAA